MTIKELVRNSAKQAAWMLGMHVVRKHNVPSHTWLGLGNRPINTIVDVGANRGQFAREARRRFPFATIHAIEPLPGPFRDLQAWGSQQGGAVITYQVAAGDQAKTMTMNVHVDHSPSSSMLFATELTHKLYPFTERKETIQVGVDLLDSILDGVRLEQEVLVKLDVQGVEDRVIRGASAVLACASVVIAEVSIDVLYDGQATFRDVFMGLDALDFDYIGNLDQAHTGSGRVTSLDAVFIRRG
jgi:FkbM family methyltransferase